MMDKFILFLSSSSFSTCETPAILQIIYFGKLLFNIVHILLPIALIIYMMFDFFKCLIIGDESKQRSVVKLSLKRIMYAVIVYAVPYIISIFAELMSDFIPDYNSCLLNATPEKIEYYSAQYDAAERMEEERSQQNKQQWKEDLRNKFETPDYPTTNFFKSSVNLKQGSGPWAKYPIACAKNRSDATIKTSGCGYVAYTMVVRHFGFSDVTPDQIVDIACNEYNYNYSAASHALLTSKTLNERYGLTAKKIKKSEIEDALREGAALIINIPGHYISILGIHDDDTLIVGDSAYRKFASNGKYTVDTLYKATTTDFREPYKWKGIIAYYKK